jgi:hypothetical protein
MADKNLLRTGNSTIEAYRSSDAAPDNWEDAKFWLINELRRIQNGFFSVDDVVSQIGSGEGDVGDTIIQNITSNIVNDGATIQEIIDSPQFQELINNIEGTQGPAGPEGPQGPQGPAGQDGNAADVIADYRTALDTTWSSEKIAGELANFTAGGGGIEEAPQDGTPYSRQDATWVPAADLVEVNYWLSGGLAISNSLDLMDGGDANSTPANLTVESGLLTVGI